MNKLVFSVAVHLIQTQRWVLQFLVQKLHIVWLNAAVFEVDKFQQADL